MDYTETKTYQAMSAADKKAFAEYKKAYAISGEQAALLFRLEDLRHLSSEEKRRGNRLPQMLVLSAMAVFLAASAAENKELLLAASIAVIGASIIYFTGIMNPITRQIKVIKKELRQFPQIGKWRKEQRNETNSDKIS